MEFSSQAAVLAVVVEDVLAGGENLAGDEGPIAPSTFHDS
jgi:hypothetical protein